MGTTFGSFIGYVRQLLDDKRRNPVVGMIFQLIFAGHDTTTHLMGMAYSFALTVRTSARS